ncbi:MerR family DNA-binding transcriptional regulator [Geodermatophilus sp. SYSU D01106]
MLIGEVARRSGVSARMLRHYDALGLVSPSGRTVGGYREYSADDVRRIFAVEGLRSLGLSLEQVGRALADPAFAPAALVADLVRAAEERLARERELLERLRAVEGSAPADWPDVLRVVGLLQELAAPSAARRQRAALADDLPVPARVLAGAVLAEDDPNVAGALRWALARSGDGGLPALAGGLRSDDAAVRRRAVRAVAAQAGTPGADDLLRGALADPDAAVRGDASLALGRRGEPAAVPALVAMVVAGTADVDAAEALGALSRDPADAGAVLAALVAELGAPGAGPAVRIRLAQALVEVPGPAAREALRRLAADADPGVALVAAALAGMPELPAGDPGDEDG